MTNYFVHLIIDEHLSSADDLYLVLFENDPKAANDWLDEEISGDNYERRLIEFSGAEDRGTENLYDVEFGPAEDNWPDIYYVGVVSDTQNELLFSEALDTPEAVAEGNTLRFPSESLSFGIDE